MEDTGLLEKQNISLTFDKISNRYDIINSVISFGLDSFWRRKLKRFCPSSPFSLLDVACGTGKQVFSIAKNNPYLKEAKGVDLSEKMLGIAKSSNQILQNIDFLKGDAQNLQFDDAAFDIVTISFGIRNLPDPSQGLSEMFRVLKEGGKLLVLEHSVPKSSFIRSFYLFYLRKILPKIGGFLSKNPAAYSYLNKTIESFPSGKDFCDLLKNSGFNNVVTIGMTFGSVTLYIGHKIGSDS